MESIYEICYYGGLILAILLLIAAIILFIVLKIPKVFGELTGHSASKSVKEMKGEKGVSRSASKREKEKYYGQGSSRIKVRELVAENTRKDKNDAQKVSQNIRDGEETMVLGAEKNINVADTEATEILQEADMNEAVVTEVLQSNKFNDGELTVVLTDNHEDTTDVLMPNDREDVTDVLRTSNGIGDVNSVPEKLNGSEGNIGMRENSDDGEGVTDVLKNFDDGEETTSVLSGNMTSELAKRVKVSYNIIITHTEESL